MNLKDTYNKIAEEWFKDHNTDTWWVEGTDYFASLLKKGDSVLDVGCGAGVKSKYLEDKGLEVMGIDFSDKLIDIAKATSPQSDFSVMDMREVDKIGKKFDGVFAQASLLHIQRAEIQEVIGKLSSVLKEDGILYIAVKGMREDGIEEEVKKENDYGYEYERFFSYYTMDELKNYLAEVGLEVVYENANKTGKTEWLHIIGKN